MNKAGSLVTAVCKLLIVFCAALLMGFGISMYYVSGLGSDPISTFLEALATLFGLQSGTMSILMNLLVVAIFLFFKRKLIHVGTFLQTFFVGTGINLGMMFWHSVWSSQQLWANLLLSVVGAVLIGVSLALYLPCNMGASPTDILVLSVCGLIKKSYKWGFYTIYAISLTLGILLGGVWGAGTLISLVLTGWVADSLIPRTGKLFAQWFGEEVTA